MNATLSSVGLDRVIVDVTTSVNGPVNYTKGRKTVHVVEVFFSTQIDRKVNLAVGSQIVEEIKLVTDIQQC